MDENTKKALEAVDVRIERVDDLNKFAHQSTEVRCGFIEARMDALQNQIKEMEERIEKLES